MTKRLIFICLIFLWTLVGAQDLVAQDLGDHQRTDPRWDRRND